MALAREFLNLGEAIHGGPVESSILSRLEEIFPDHVSIPVTTKYWNIEHEEVRINNKLVKSVAMPYTSGCARGKIGREIGLYQMPPHPFAVKNLPISNHEVALFYEENKLRRITLPPGSPPSFFLDRKVEGYAEVCSSARLTDTESRNVEVKVRDGDSYIVLGAHVDHWLTGFHDNLLSVEILAEMKEVLEKIKLKHGLKIVFFSSEEGPRCCMGSSQYPMKDVFAIISLDAIYPSRVVFSSTPDLWFLSRHFRIKRIEMPTPFSDHFPFVQRGIPGLVLYNDDMIGVYHSNVDLPLQEDVTYKENLKDSLVKAILELDSTTEERLYKEFMRVARESGYSGDKREGSIIPDLENLTSKFRK